MRNPKTSLLTLLIAGLAFLGVTACGGEAPAPTALPTSALSATPVPASATPQPPAPTATSVPAAATPTLAQSTAMAIPSLGTVATGPAIDLIDSSMQAMKRLTSYHIKMSTSASDGGTIRITGSGEGVVVPPDKMRLTMDLGRAGKTEMLVLGNDMYVKPEGADNYTSLGATGGTQSAFLNPGGIGATFGQYAEAATILGDETLDGVNTTHVSFTYDVDRYMQATGVGIPGATPAVPLGKSTGEMWIEKGTNYLRHLKIDAGNSPSTTAAQPSGSIVTIDYSNFNEPVQPPIEKPSGVDGAPGAETPVP